MIGGDLEIGLRWDRKQANLFANLRFDMPKASADDWLEPDAPMDLDLDDLRTLEADKDACARRLTEHALRPADVGPFYRKAREVSESNGPTFD